ncbi:MAG: hypothetical protein EPN22_02820 [Nitrospirae bacterium]|nr:MAG: hypothetical protein EPN22_02820 [Nitrospirota bacterium]
MINRGSEWRKWDLHVHTPFTKFSNNYVAEDGADIWNEFCNIIENSDVEAFGITDYFSVENYFIFIDKFRTQYPNSKKVFFLNIELRLEVSVNKKAEEVNIHIIFTCKPDKSKVESFLSKLQTNMTRNGAPLFCKDLTGKEYESAGVDYKKIKPILKEVFGNDECYLIFAAANNAGLRPDTSSPRKLNITDEIDKVCDGFFGGHQNINYFLDTNRYETDEKALSKPVISGCDAHSFGDLLDWLGKRIIGNENEIQRDITWIKAEPTFEGLKQIIYDPGTRVIIGEKTPVQPTNVIDSITFNIPQNAKITVDQNNRKAKEDIFCFANIQTTFYFSPFFNCFIGGRGSGKSTVLNFLGQYSTDSSSSRSFWEKIQPSFDTADTSIFSFSGIETFEFIGQSEVESFATNKEAFTNAIYERANIYASLEGAKIKLDLCLEKIKKFVPLLKTLNEIKEEQRNIKKDKKILENSVKITESKEYSDIIDKITKKSNQKQELERWKNRIDELRKSVANLQEQYFPTLEEESDEGETVAADEQNTEENIARLYQEAYGTAQSSIKSAEDALDEKKFTDLVKQEEELLNEIEGHEQELSQLLKNAGLSEENILQVKSSPQKLIKIENDLAKVKKRIDDTNKSLNKYDDIIKESLIAKKEYEEKIKDSIKPLVTTLETQAKENDKEDIKNIGLSYFFDDQQAWKDIAKEFYNYFSDQYNEVQRSDLLKGFIFDNKEIFESSQDNINKLLKNQNNTEYISFLKNVFSVDLNYKIFLVIRDTHLNDVSKYKRIQVLYDNRDIEHASFGQKCTAVIVILLLFGNYPLIIDEPEAHLDSSLIANYLVPLIKKNKNNRQIFFATHNANFVVNGDAEKIFILKNETGTTEFVETTIEDLNNRIELLKLEGGKEAFQKRGEKLSIKL